ncbi:MAG TPA: hypothetical protein PK720_01965 [bacterium]|nr:hypothetical protein [bacterium]
MKLNKNFQLDIILGFLHGRRFEDNEEVLPYCELANFLIGGTSYSKITPKNYHLAQPIVAQIFLENVYWDNYLIDFFLKNTSQLHVTANGLKYVNNMVEGDRNNILVSVVKSEISYVKEFEKALQLSERERKQFIYFDHPIGSIIEDGLKNMAEVANDWETIHTRPVTVFCQFSSINVLIKKNSDLKLTYKAFRKHLDDNSRDIIVGPCIRLINKKLFTNIKKGETK